MEVNLISAALLLILSAEAVSYRLEDVGTNFVPDRQKKPTKLFLYKLHSSGSLPVDDLIEDPREMFDPLPSDINIKALRKQLGSNFDSKYMSIHDPRNRPHTPELPRRRPKGPLPSYLHFKRNARTPDGRKIRLNVSKETRKKFQNFLWELTQCAVQYTWKLLNVRFWPRWVKEGSCYKHRSCSLTHSMNCTASGSVEKVFMRWHCRDFEQRLSCRWIEFNYPIISECSCSC